MSNFNSERQAALLVRGASIGDDEAAGMIPAAFPDWSKENEYINPEDLNDFDWTSVNLDDFLYGIQFTPINHRGTFPPNLNSGSQPANAPLGNMELTTSAPIKVSAQSKRQRCESGKGNRQQWSNKSLQITRNNVNYRENQCYEALRHAPQSWGPFAYTTNGELNPSDLFTPDQIMEYLFQHPLHQGCQFKQESELILYVHGNPPDSARRFPTSHGSHRCRFEDCPAQNNTINQGQYAVIFDELSSNHPSHDPFLNAAWVHLYCLERFCDFPKICKLLNVRAENRVFDKESNNNKGNNCLRLDKIKGVEPLVENFIRHCRENTLPHEYPRFNDRNEVGAPYDNTLCQKMCLEKQKGQPKAVNRQESVRQQAAGRRGASLSNHLGDLAIEAPMRYSTRKHGNQNQLMANPRHKRVYKHDKVENECEDGDGYYHEDERPRKRQQRYVALTANIMQPNQSPPLNEDLRLAMPRRMMPTTTEGRPYDCSPPVDQPSSDILGAFLKSPTDLLRKRQMSRRCTRDCTRTNTDDIAIASKRRRSSELREHTSFAGQQAVQNGNGSGNISPGPRSFLI